MVIMRKSQKDSPGWQHSILDLGSGYRMFALYLFLEMTQ